MEELNENQELEARESYKPRPKWQIALAWVGLVIMIICVILYYYHIANGGIL